MLPAYPDSQTLVDPRFTFVDKADPGIVDSRLSGFADKEGLMDSRILPDSRQNMIAFNDSKEHVISQETRYVFQSLTLLAKLATTFFSNLLLHWHFHKLMAIGDKS